jgi:hypothetical protein
MHKSEQYKRFLNRLGYYNYQEGLIFRYIKQEDGWKDHLCRCRDYILKIIADSKPEKVTILGSGWLLDCPLREIAEMNIPVVLIDIAHPPEAVKQVSALKNVEMIEDDITGGLIYDIWRKTVSIPVFRKLKTLDDIKIPRYRFNGDPGLVISLNILSQLDSLPVKYLKTKSKIPEEQFTLLKEELQRKHIETLQKHNSILISDTEEIFYKKSGKPEVVKTVITEIPEGKFREEWTWNFDLKGSDYHLKKSVLKVTAISYLE